MLPPMFEIKTVTYDKAKASTTKRQCWIAADTIKLIEPSDPGQPDYCEAYRDTARLTVVQGVGVIIIHTSESVHQIAERCMVKR